MNLYRVSNNLIYNVSVLILRIVIFHLVFFLFCNSDTCRYNLTMIYSFIHTHTHIYIYMGISMGDRQAHKEGSPNSMKFSELVELFLLIILLKKGFSIKPVFRRNIVKILSITHWFFFPHLLKNDRSMNYKKPNRTPLEIVENNDPMAYSDSSWETASRYLEDEIFFQIFPALPSSHSYVKLIKTIWKFWSQK